MRGQVYTTAVPTATPPRQGGPWNASGFSDEEKNTTITGNRTPTMQPVVRHFNE
jgi:hypothetical protein